MQKNRKMLPVVKRKYSKETHPRITQILVLADNNFKATIINVFKDLEEKWP